jgi:hypothetical protein
MKADPLWNFAFVNALLARFPPQLAKDTEQVVKEVGFDGLCCALLQNKEALHLFLRSVGRMLDEVKKNKPELAKTRLAVMGHLKVGARVEPR